VQSRIAMLDISALAFGRLAIADFISGFRKRRPHVWFALAGLAFGLSIAWRWSRLFALAICIVIVVVIRLMQCWQFVDDALRRGNGPRWLSWAFVATAFAGFAAMLPISAASVGTSMETFNRLNFSELDLRDSAPTLCLSD
jgi:dolichyl-phosphate-mannose--protein O-mannosyl transferase